MLGFCALLRMLGLRALGCLGRALGALLLLLRFRYRIVASNLELALGPDQASGSRAELIGRIYGNVGITFLEISRNFALKQPQMRREMKLSPETDAHLKAVLAQGRGAIFLSAHIANWELLAMGAAAHGLPVAIVVKNMNNPLAQALIERQRQRTGLEVIYTGGTLAKMKQALAAGKIIGFMMDQNVTGPKGIRANFFGVPAASIRGLAGLVRETGVPVVPGCAVRLPDGSHELFADQPLPYLTCDIPVASEEERLLREEWLNTQQYQDAVERLVRAHLDQWLWIHRRWKTSREPLRLSEAHRENKIWVPRA